MKKDLFHLDIETVGAYPDWETFKSSDLRGAKLFEVKYNKMNWQEKYGSIDKAYLDNAGIISTYGRIVCISFGFLDNGVNKIRSFYGADEKDIVEKFNNLLKKIETKNFNLSGFRIVYFDLPWILHKLHKYGIEPANIIYMYDKKPWDMRITDISDDWKQKFAWAFSFNEVVYELGLESPKVMMDGSQVHHHYWNGRIEDIKTYCEKDVEVSIEVSKKIYKNDIVKIL
jgi:predicted PolB exonuclease-like 3'-5' exonuclease